MSNLNFAEDDEDNPRDSKMEKTQEQIKSIEEHRLMMSIFGDGKYQLVPSFFRMMIYLKKAKKDFALVFRTFGNDMPQLVHEFNKLCTGEHLCYNGKNGTPLVRLDGCFKGLKDFRIKDHS